MLDVRSDRECTPGDARFKQLEAQLTSLTDRRNTVANEIIAVLSGAAFANSEPEDTQLTTLTTRAQRLLDEMHALAASV